MIINPNDKKAPFALLFGFDKTSVVFLSLIRSLFFCRKSKEEKRD
jgi:hypothetical protein